MLSICTHASHCRAPVLQHSRRRPFRLCLQRNYGYEERDASQAGEAHRQRADHASTAPVTRNREGHRLPHKSLPEHQRALSMGLAQVRSSNFRYGDARRSERSRARGCGVTHLALLSCHVGLPSFVAEPQNIRRTRTCTHKFALAHSRRDEE